MKSVTIIIMMIILTIEMITTSLFTHYVGTSENVIDNISMFYRWE